MDSQRIEQAIENAIIKFINSDQVFSSAYNDRVDLSQEIKQA